MLDVFKNDAFSMVSLTNAMIKAPHVPTRIGSLGLFRRQGMTSTVAVIEEKNGQLELIQTTPRGGSATSLGESKRTARSFLAPHLQKESRVTADQVQGVRAFGSDDAVAAVQQIVGERLALLRKFHDVTVEYHRIKAIQGIILDADGSTLFNLFTEFSVSQQTHNIALTTATLDIRNECTAIMRKSESEMGAEMVTGYRAFCGDAFFDEFIAHANVKASFANQEGRVLRTDLRAGFEFGGITWENYRGKVGSTDFVPTAEAYIVPEGVDIFQTIDAPADYIETVNTIGLPYYVKAAPDPQWNRYVDIQSQSNPLNICMRPRAVIKVTKS